MDKNYQEESEYIDRLIKLYHPKTKSIIDLGCGTGQHDLLLAQKGYLVTGVDFSEEMLKLANEQSSRDKLDLKYLSFFPGDIREIRLKKKFDAVISLFHVISYQATNEDLLKAFKTASVHIKKNGVFIFDSWYGPCVLNVRPETKVRRIEDDSVIITRIAEPVMDFNENTVDVRYRLFVLDKATKRTDEIMESHKMRYLFQPEVRLMLENSGFEFVALLEFLKDTPPGPDSWSACFIARKRG
jgi:SAM-dependent methyltransferase